MKKKLRPINVQTYKMNRITKNKEQIYFSNAGKIFKARS